MKSTVLPAVLSLITRAMAQNVVYPPGCVEPALPDAEECLRTGWDLGDSVDPCAPEGPYPVEGQQVYIEDAVNFCIALPNPNSPTLQALVYDAGNLPKIVQGEGYIQAFCMGDYLPPGALPLNAGGVRSAHVNFGVINDKRYVEISGYLDCGALNINCTQSYPGAYDDGGQYDAVSHRQCGKSPYSGTDASRHPGMPEYNEQAGNGLYCMRVCEPGQQREDPCNVKDDTLGCVATMGVVFREGFSTTYQDGRVVTHDVQLPPPSDGVVGGLPDGRTPVTSASDGAAPTGAGSGSGSGSGSDSQSGASSLLTAFEGFLVGLGLLI